MHFLKKITTKFKNVFFHRFYYRYFSPSPDEVVKTNTQEAFNFFYDQNHFIENDYLNSERLNFYEDICNYCEPLLKKLKGNGKEIKLVDVGCGTGHMLLALSKREVLSKSNVQWYGLDFADSAIEKAKKNFPYGNYRVEDFFNNTLPKRQFDLVLCMETIEHIQDVDKFVLKLKELCNEEGYLVIAVPNGKVDHWEGHIHFWDYDRFYNFLSPHGLICIKALSNETNLVATLGKKDS